MKQIYIAVPYASNPQRGIELSIKYGQQIAREGNIPVSPVLMFDPIFTCPDLCEETHKSFILECCTKLLGKCDEAIFIIPEDMETLSNGQYVEWKYCEWHNIKSIVKKGV